MTLNIDTAQLSTEQLFALADLFNGLAELDAMLEPSRAQRELVLLTEPLQTLRDAQKAQQATSPR